MLTHITLPGGGKLGVYQPRHARPKSSFPPAKPKARESAQRKKKKARH
jgi:hypothetical protein